MVHCGSKKYEVGSSGKTSEREARGREARQTRSALRQHRRATDHRADQELDIDSYGEGLLPCLHGRMKYVSVKTANSQCSLNPSLSELPRGLSQFADVVPCAFIVCAARTGTSILLSLDAKQIRSRSLQCRSIPSSKYISSKVVIDNILAFGNGSFSRQSVAQINTFVV